jgi:5-methylcytosine-specific restriction protein B
MEDNIKEILSEFLEQAKTTNLKTKQFPRSLMGFKLKVSFGQGNSAKIPWISFLGENQTTSNGIYPVYLYFKEYEKLILAYGISEENKPRLEWDVNTSTIYEYFEKGNHKADRYGDSYIFKVYNTDRQLDWNEIELDLEQLLQEYQDLLLNDNEIESPTKSEEVMNLTIVSRDFSNAGMQMHDNIIVRFVGALITKPFVILTGLSGSGKTKLAVAFAKWIAEHESQICVVPVGADWTNREPLLGYPNALETGKYILPENGALSLMLEAARKENAAKPYFLILDEMNLSHVERYFADFLSAMESSERIALHPETSDWRDDVPSKVSLPSNLFIVGTVNIDETTYMFSPKVLDRANVIEFRVTAEEMASYLTANKLLNIESLAAAGANMAASFISLASDRSLKTNNAAINATLLKFFDELKKAGAEFGYRSASEILRFAAVIDKIEPTWGIDQILDAAIMQKLLPKVHGSRKKLVPVLEILGGLCLQDGNSITDVFGAKTEVDFKDNARFKYPTSVEKIVRMHRSLIENGFTSYAEA